MTGESEREQAEGRPKKVAKEKMGGEGEPRNFGREKQGLASSDQL